MPLHSFLGIFLVLLSLFHGCSREEKEEHAGSDGSLPPESLRIVFVAPEGAAEQRVTTGSLVEAIIPSQRKKCVRLIVNPKPKPPNTLGSASGFAPNPDGHLFKSI
mgnify:CR=1 FL=1